MRKWDQKNKVLERLVAMARNFTDSSIAILAEQDEEIVRFDIRGKPDLLPQFCTLMRSRDPNGRSCRACRHLILFSAHFRGLTEYTCHGGIQMVVAPVPSCTEGTMSPTVVVSSAFSLENREKGWKAVRSHVRGSPIDLESLRKAYFALPVLTNERAVLLRAIIDLAATALSEAARSGNFSCPPESFAHDSFPEDGGMSMAHLLAMLSERVVEDPLANTGHALTDTVIAMLHHNPSLPFTVAEIARAARMTPNHFSTLFRKHAGKTFSEFLAECRINKAKSLLRDTTRKVHEVAVQSGFQDSAYFSRRFKQLTGQSATAWRHRNCS
ncbi:MAG TPA: helix-turn-helix domain-containing protein [Candidatus Hydrogenedentes bacterium]|nr:helix-turn-helix domain-containing protein [Candidatus Hydrogenedentota bacterium]